MVHRSNEKQACLIKEGRYFNYKEKDHLAYDYPRKKKVAAILKGISKDGNTQRKE